MTRQLGIKFLAAWLTIAATVGLPLAQAQAEEQAQENCTLIESARERLACFDRVFPRDEDTVLPEITSEVIRAPDTLGQEPTVPAQAPDAPQSGPRPKESGGFFDKALFEWKENVEFTATVAAVKAEESKRMVFRLDNDEIWMQASARYVPIKKGDTVTIKSGRIGGYVMRNQNNTSTRVQRIK